MTERRLTIINGEGLIAQPVQIAHNVQRPLAERIQRLQAEAKALAAEHADALAAALWNAARLAEEVAFGGEAYPVGVREIANRLRGDLKANADSLTAISERVSR